MFFTVSHEMLKNIGRPGYEAVVLLCVYLHAGIAKCTQVLFVSGIQITH